MTVWLIRHAESTLNAAGIRHRREDVPLTTAGIGQAAAIRLPGTPTIVCSPLLRAYATACIIAHTHGLEAPIIADELAERDWGQTTGDVADVAANYLAGLRGDVVAVTHAGVLKGLLGLDVTPANGSIHQWCP